MKWKREEQIETDSFLLGCFNRKRKGIPIWVWSLVMIVAMMLLAVLGGCESNPAWAETGTVSWFSNIETGGKNCADGKYHDLNTEYVIASWRFPLNTLVRVTTMDGHSIICRTVDHGPGRRDGTSRYYKGRRIADLSKAVFALLSPSGTTKEGLIKVSVWQINQAQNPGHNVCPPSR